jgi:small-conductance mechanosensitive channel
VVVAAFGSEVTAFMYRALTIVLLHYTSTHKPSSVRYPFFTLLISLSFIFGNTLRSILESCIFLFLVRPFDVGDGTIEFTYF